MQENFKDSLERVLVHEGGWADHPEDPGGATMKGVTLAVFRRYYGADKSKQDLRKISNRRLAHIYRSGYWDKCKCDELPSGVDYAVFDSAVNSGPARGIKWLQGAVGAAQDGSIGPTTLAKVAKRDPAEIVDKLLDRRLRFLQGLRIWPTFGRGWRRRVEGVRETALAMAGNPLPGHPQTPDVDYPILRQGDSGEWVFKLQVALGIHFNGKFGPETEKALKAFQGKNGLEVDGIAGRNTYRALGLIA